MCQRSQVLLYAASKLKEHDELFDYALVVGLETDQDCNHCSVHVLFHYPEQVTSLLTRSFLSPFIHSFIHPSIFLPIHSLLDWLLTKVVTLALFNVDVPSYHPEQFRTLFHSSIPPSIHLCFSVRKRTILNSVN